MTLLNKLCKKTDRFTINALSPKEHEILEELEKAVKNGFLVKREIIRCDDCGSDLGLYMGQEEVFCPMCERYKLVSEDMITLTFYLTQKGEKFFRAS